MKYAIIIVDGGADLPVEELGGKTPLEIARTPNMDAVASLGRVGTAATTPEPFEAGSDVCSMSLLGYDPRRYHTGRAPLEAAALGLKTGPRDWIFRLNFITVGEAGQANAGLMLDHSAGAITSREARVLAADLLKYWKEREPRLSEGLELHPGVSYRNILVDRSGRGYANVTTTPPHEVPGEPWAEHVPEGSAAESVVLKRLIELSSEMLPEHEVNAARRAQGLRPANLCWIWGGGTRPTVPSFKDRYGVSGAMITAVDLLAGISSYIGWERLECPGISSYHDTDYAMQGRVTCAGLEKFDVVCCHVESPDEASHQGDFETKVAALEAIDQHVVGPVLEKLKTFGDPERDPRAEGWRILILPDHYTLVSTRKHDATPVPFAMAGSWVRSLVKRPFSEAEANSSDLHIAEGHELMEYFLKGGGVSRG